MPRPSHREKLLQEGLRTVHRRGFTGASVRDIVQAAGVPQGSFTNHFLSKEAFSLEILNLYFDGVRGLIEKTLHHQTLSPIQRLRTYLDANRDALDQAGAQYGCLFGNFAAEASDHSELVRLRLIEIFVEIQQAIADCLRAAVKAREVPSKLNCDETAAFIFASFQGAILLAKTRRELAPVERFKEILFSQILR